MEGDSTRRPDPRKHRLRVGDLTIVIALLAADLALLRSCLRGEFLASVGPFAALPPLVGLLAIMVGFVQRYVPRGWDRAGYLAALALYFLALAAYLAARNPALAAPLGRALGVQ